MIFEWSHVSRNQAEKKLEQKHTFSKSYGQLNDCFTNSFNKHSEEGKYRL